MHKNRLYRKVLYIIDFKYRKFIQTNGLNIFIEIVRVFFLKPWDMESSHNIDAYNLIDEIIC